MNKKHHTFSKTAEERQERFLQIAPLIDYSTY